MLPTGGLKLSITAIWGRGIRKSVLIENQVNTPSVSARNCHLSRNRIACDAATRTFEHVRDPVLFLSGLLSPFVPHYAYLPRAIITTMAPMTSTTTNTNYGPQLDLCRAKTELHAVRQEVQELRLAKVRTRNGAG